MIESIACGNLFSKEPMISFMPETELCPNCQSRLHVLKTEMKTLLTLHLGKFTAHVTFKNCDYCHNHTVYVSKEPWLLVPYHCNFGYDVIVYVGQSVFQKYRPAKEIVKDLARKKNVFLSESEVYFLAKKFIAYLSIAHRECCPAIRNYMKKKGGYILHIDGTCDAGSSHLITVIDGVSNFILDSIKIPTENSNQIIPMLEKIKDAYGVPLAMVSDMGSAITLALMTVFDGVSHFICHFHFLRDLGKDLLESEYSIIRNQVTTSGMYGKLQGWIRSYEKEADFNSTFVSDVISCLEKGNFSPLSISRDLMKVYCYSFLLWALRAKSQGGAYGFPFDRQHLVFYQRLNTVYSILQAFMINHAQDPNSDLTIARQLMDDLEVIVHETSCQQALPGIIEKIDVFDALRDAMRITPQDGTKGLNDDGSGRNIKTIERSVKKFYNNLVANYSDKNDYKKMIIQIKKYWEKLFADGIAVTTSEKTITIQPQRTNNKMERFFRLLKRLFLRKNGTTSLSNVLNTMLAGVPLIRNLENVDYRTILLNGKTTIEERFAEIDSEKARSEIKKNQNQNIKVTEKNRKNYQSCRLS